jgi:heptosyltransferase-1
MNSKRNAAERKRILIIRPSSMGDIVMASPMLRILRNAYPGASIAWLADPAWIDLLRFNPDIDEVISWDKARWKGLWKKGRLYALLREIMRFSEEMHSRRFDLALDAQGLIRSRILARLSGAGERVGFDSREPGRFLMTRIISCGPDNKRMGSEYDHMMRELGIPPSPFLPNLVLPEEDMTAARQAIRKAGIRGGYAAICPFTTRPQKHWVRERWGDLAMAIRRDFGIPLVMLGGPEDRKESVVIGSYASDKLFDFTGRLTLAQSSAVIKESALAIGVDTGLTHLAVAFGRPTVALFGATCPYLHSENERALVLYRKLPCSPCRRRPTCEGDFTCMKKIRVGDVLEAARRVLKNG